MASTGRGVGQDEKEAVKWYRLSARQEHGHALAPYILGTMHNAGKSVEQDDKEAVKWYQLLAAGHGFAMVQHNLGVMYAK